MYDCNDCVEVYEDVGSRSSNQHCNITVFGLFADWQGDRVDIAFDWNAERSSSVLVAEECMSTERK